jgi:GrpB-like predicted nucleotidyltransferase (UPF0157 family)
MSDEMSARRADATAVTLAPHDPDWLRAATAEAARIAAGIGSTLLRVEHIGSTAIPGIVAKPTIDLMPLVRNHNDLDACRAPMEALGYRWRGEYGIAGRRYSVMERDGRRLFHVHIFAEGNGNVARHLAFRDYLRAHREEVMAYEAAKRAAAEAHPGDSLAYSLHKSGWISACLQRATAWAQAR